MVFSHPEDLLGELNIVFLDVPRVVENMKSPVVRVKGVMLMRQLSKPYHATSSITITYIFAVQVPKKDGLMAHLLGLTIQIFKPYGSVFLDLRLHLSWTMTEYPRGLHL